MPTAHIAKAIAGVGGGGVAHVLLVWVTAPAVQHVGAGAETQPCEVVIVPVWPDGHDAVPVTGAGAELHTGGGVTHVFTSPILPPVFVHGPHEERFVVGAGSVVVPAGQE